ncbi:MAG: GNAT family N-acetyltransferase [Saprospirales bacterium]|nr:GNAT family N-acetyltransferase [Saprospirales bacterium]
MELTIRPVQHKRDLRTYIFLPEAIHAQHANWMPPLFMDEWTYYNPKKNKAFSYCDTILLLAFRGKKPVGRIMGIIHHPYNEKVGMKTVRFAHFDCVEDEAVAKALLSAVEAWGQEKGMTEIVGPFGFSDKDPEGFMVEGFGELPILVTNCNLPYMPRFMEAFGYGKKTDCLDFLLDIAHGVPEKYPLLFERVQLKSRVRVREFHRKKDLRPYFAPVFYLINETYKDLYGFVPLDDREIQEMVDRYLPILDTRYVKIALDENDQVVGFVIGIPNMAQGIQKARGRLFPLGLIHILQSARRTEQLDLMLGAVHPDYRNRGLNILMGWLLIQSARAAGIATFETHLVLESNRPMLAEYEKMGAKLHKRFRIYRKDLG